MAKGILQVTTVRIVRQGTEPWWSLRRRRQSRDITVEAGLGVVDPEVTQKSEKVGDRWTLQTGPS